MFPCAVCSLKGKYVTTNFRRYIEHYRSCHPDSPIICNVNSCPRAYKTTKSYVKHLKNNHPAFHAKFWLQPERLNVSEAPLENADTDTAENASTDVMMSDDEEVLDESSDGTSFGCQNEEDQSNVDYDDSIRLFLLELREEKRASGVACEFVVQRISSLMEAQISADNQRLVQVLLSLGISKEKADEVLARKNPLLEALNKYHFQTTLNSHVASHPEFVSPTEVNAGYDEENQKTESYQYVPIFDTLQVVLSRMDNMRHLIDPEISRDGLIRCFRDGSVFSENALYSSNSNALQINVYSDEFQCSNPLKANSKYKINGFYFTLGNFPRKMRSSLKAIHLLALCPGELIKKYGYASILRPAVDDLIKLETHGIKIVSNSSTIDVNGTLLYGTVSMLIGDNLGQHGIGGFPESFSLVKRVCRYCMVDRDDMCNHHDDLLVDKRTPTMHDTHLTLVEANPKFKTVYGIKGRCVFNELNFFHIIRQQPFDVSHDLYEGFAVDLISYATKYFIQCKFFTLKEYNHIIKTFRYAEIDKSDKPQITKPPKTWDQFKIKQNAGEMSTLIRLYPIMFGHFIPEKDPVYLSVLQFLHVVELICAPSFLPGEVEYMRSEIADMLEGYISSVPDVHLKPKGHFLTHYPSQILELGPPVDHNTIRFEGKHNFFKEVYRRTNNRINLCKTLATRHQYYMYLQYRKVDQDTPHLTFIEETPTILLDAMVRRKVEELGGPSIVSQGQSITYEGQKYSDGGAVLLGFSDDTFVFGIIEYIYMVYGVPILFGTKLSTVGFNVHLNSYEVLLTAQKFASTIAELYDYHPLGIYNNVACECSLIPLKYHLFQHRCEDS